MAIFALISRLSFHINSGKIIDNSIHLIISNNNNNIKIYAKEYNKLSERAVSFSIALL